MQDGFGPRPGSSSIDNGTLVVMMRDNAGVAVPLDWDSNGTSEPDIVAIGAYEYNQ